MDENELISAGRRLGVRSILTGEQDPVLQAETEAHAANMASLGRGGHQRWEQRSDQIARALPKFSNFREVAAESYPNRDERQGAEDAFDGWRGSRGHWRSVNGQCAAWGYAMAYSNRTRRWYACGIFADRRFAEHADEAHEA